ncbi:MULTISPECIES: hypothetical protein [Microbispora]|uniref:SapB/AmfS family lantipeptide n=1 Tax=Microbispora siamensis TaxID=564413 RepID=A0ABQ4GSQ7_9ACTN|nr:MULTISPECIES: hypothetical protein [Microbispora]GIH64462.1 hypothetical protein Msi02_52790 [Microbispora siamensis]
MKNGRTELRDITALGAELDESLLVGISGGMLPNGATSLCGVVVHTDDWWC